MTQSETEFERPIYAGNAVATVRSEQALQLLTVRPTNFEKTTVAESAQCEAVEEINNVEEAIAEGEDIGLSFVANHVSESERAELSSARFVVSGGRGLKNGENFKLLYDLAEALGG